MGQLKRGCDPVLLSALAGHFHPVLLTQADWPDGVARAHTGIGDMSWNGSDWTGQGRLVQWEVPQETAGLATAEAQVTVAATLQDILAERSKPVRNRAVTVWWGATTEPAGNVLVGAPVQLFTGYFDSRTMALRREGDGLSHNMVLGVGVGPSARSGASVQHGAEDQAARYPGDTAGRHVINAIKAALNPPAWPQL